MSFLHKALKKILLLFVQILFKTLDKFYRML